MPKKQKAETIVTCPVRLQFVHLFEPHTPDRRKGDPNFIPKYECVLLFDKSDEKQMASLDTIKALATKTAKAKFGKDTAGIRSPFRDADEEGKEYDGYPGHIFVRVSTKYKPKIINKAGVRLETPEQVYAGCWCHVNVGAYAYDNESKGVSMNLGNLCFDRDDDAFSGGGTRPEDDFADLTTPVDPAAAGDDGMFD